MAVDCTAHKDITKAFQLVKHWDEVPDSKKEFPYLAQFKYDGVFCAVYVQDGDFTFLSRTGKEFYYELHELPRFMRSMPTQDGVWIGELVNSSITLEELSGLVNPNRVKLWDSDQVRSMEWAQIMFHDYLSITEFFAGVSERKYLDRLQTVLDYTPKLSVARTELVETPEQLDNFVEAIIARGGEGAVIKRPDAGYEAGHKGWRSMKIVRGIHVDLKCLAVETGKGKRTGQIARLQFKYKGKAFWADLGKGWTDGKRIALTEQWKDSVRTRGPAEAFPVGFVFHVKGLQESSKGVIRLPKVMELRIDKDTEDAT